MLKHIVMWQLKEENKSENMRLMKEKLEALEKVIPVIRRIQVGFNENGGEYDIVLVTDFDDMAALKEYDTHPEHQKVREFVKGAAEKRAAVDYSY